MSSEDFEHLLGMIKAMAHESRLKLLGVLADRECSVEELAAMLGLKAPTISHHLTRLRDAGLVTMRGDGNSHLYRLDAAALRALRKSFGGPRRVASLVDDADFESWERKVLATFVDADEKLVDLPTSRKKRRVILEWLVEKFDRGRRYPEKELNEVLLKHHWDSATLRREMVATALLERKKAGV